MKYYYISHEGPFRNNVVIGKDFDRINRDKNKIIITRINGSFHVLICKNGNYEKEKLVLSYFDLVDFLKRVSFNVYFVNISSETAYHINSYVKKEDVVNRKEIREEKKEEFYAINNDSMLKLEAYVNRNVIKKSIYRIYEHEISDEKRYHEISLTDFIQNEELFEIYHLPFVEKNGQFLVPNYSYSVPKPFYILSGIYNKDGDVICLSGDDLKNIYMIGNMEREVASDILSNIEVRILEQHPLSSINNVVDFLDKYHHGEDNNTKLKVLKNRLVEAKENQGIVERVLLLTETREKEKSLNKE